MFPRNSSELEGDIGGRTGSRRRVQFDKKNGNDNPRLKLVAMSAWT
jgi:hypothetical protein